MKILLVVHPHNVGIVDDYPEANAAYGFTNAQEIPRITAWSAGRNDAVDIVEDSILAVPEAALADLGLSDFVAQYFNCYYDSTTEAIRVIPSFARPGEPVAETRNLLATLVDPEDPGSERVVDENDANVGLSLARAQLFEIFKTL